MKKNLKSAAALFLALALVLTLFAGCGKKQPPEASPTDDVVQPADTQTGLWFTLNGVEIRMDVPYADLAPKLGDEVKPSETIDSCDPDSDWKQICHFYAGITVNEDKDGNVFGVDMNDSNGAGDVTLNGSIRLGSTLDEIKSVFGEPESEDLTSIFYTFGGYTLGLYLDETTLALTGAAVMQSP